MARNTGVDIARARRIDAARKTDVELGAAARRIGQPLLPLSIVEAGVPGAVVVEDVAHGVVIELDPEAIELDVLEQPEHFVVGGKWALRGAGDDVVASRSINVGAEFCDHGSVAFVAACASE